MASPGFPQRKSQGAGGMTGGGMTSILDGPPPSPAQPDTTMVPGQQPMMPSFAEMAQPLTAGTPGRAVAPEIAMGLMQSATVIYGMLDSMASIAPDLANEFALQKDLLQRSMSKLLLNGGQPAAPNAPGLNFPGGGFSSGSM